MKTKDLSDYRMNYNQNALLENNCSNNPMNLFSEWFTTADEDESVIEANAMTLATIGLDGFPKNRVVLLKKFDNKGFVFFTNYESEKGRAIAVNSNVCLSFFWEGLERQVIVKGFVSKLSDTLSNEYFASRPKESQLGACASAQSQVVGSRDELEDNMMQLKKEYENKPVQRPSNWGGYVVSPVSIEFWQGRPNRMHDRILYLLDGKEWELKRLAP